MKKLCILMALALFVTVGITQAQQADSSDSLTSIAETLYSYLPETWKKNIPQSWHDKALETLKQASGSSSAIDFYQQLSQEIKKYLSPEQQEALKSQILNTVRQFITNSQKPSTNSIFGY